ncbi:MAG: transposase [Limisphaerales bacterium]
MFTINPPGSSCRAALACLTTTGPVHDHHRRIQWGLGDGRGCGAEIFTDLPGAGPALAPRLVAFFGTDRSRFEAAKNAQSVCGIAPVTKSSGRSSVVHFRMACPKPNRQTFHEFARLSVGGCQWARNYVDYYRSKGKKYNTIIRALAFKWIRILFRCWKNQTPYKDNKYLETLKKHGSIFATLHLEKK